MIFFSTLLIILFIFACGYSVVNLFGLQIKSLIEKLSYSWGLGVGLIGTQLFFYSLLTIEWSKFTLVAPWLAIILFSFWKNKPKFILKKEKLDRLEKSFLVLILLLLGFTAFESILRPVQAWDGWLNWLLRPRVFFINNNISLDYVRYTTDGYPLIIPLMSTFYYKLIGQINDKNVLLLFFTFYLVVAGLFYAKSKELMGRKLALIFTFLLISTQNLIRHGGRYEAGHADLALSYFILAVACLLINYLKTRALKDLLLFNIFLGFSALVKNDGIPIFLIGNLLTVFYIIKSKKLINAVSLIPSIFLFGSWNLYKHFSDYPKNWIAGSGSFHYDKIGSIIITMSKEFFNFQNWSLLFIVFIFALLIYHKNIKKIFPVFLLILVQFFFYVLAFILSPFLNPVDHVAGVINRLYIHIAPLALLITVALISVNAHGEEKNGKKS